MLNNSNEYGAPIWNPIEKSKWNSNKEEGKKNRKEKKRKEKKKKRRPRSPGCSACSAHANQPNRPGNPPSRLPSTCARPMSRPSTSPTPVHPSASLAAAAR